VGLRDVQLAQLESEL